MEPTEYLERWMWLGLALLALVLLSPPAVLLGLVLWLWVRWKHNARLRLAVAGILLLLSWGGLILLWGTLVGQLLALRQVVLGLAGPDVVFARVWPIWVEGILLFPTIAGLIQLFRPTKPGRSIPAQQAATPGSALGQAPAAQAQLAGKARQLTMTRPALSPDQAHDSLPKRSP